MKYLKNIVKDYSRDNLITEFGKVKLNDGYMMDGETSPQDRFAYVSSTFASNKDHAQRLYDYSSKLWLSYSTPVLSFGRNKKGLPISCYLNRVTDDLDGLLKNLTETSFLSVLGGGVGVKLDIRSIDNKSAGVMSHCKTYESSMQAYKQSEGRRGSYAIYLDISHPEIVNFVNMRKPTGDHKLKCLELHHAINIPDSFMEIIERCMQDDTADDSWGLVCPNSGEVIETVSAKELWKKIIDLRLETGEPYIHFIDTSNRHLPQHLKDKGLEVVQSNLCVAPETLIMTKEYGYKDIVSLENTPVHVWNGQEWSLVTPMKTSDKSELIKVTFDDDSFIECTKEHKFWVNDLGTYTNAIDLNEGDVIDQFSLPDGDVNEVIKIRSVDITGRFDKTYCFTEPKRNRGMFNGVLTGQCSEIILPTSKERTAVCCLSSLNVELYDDWKNDPLFIRDVVEMLDNVLQYFIDNAPKEIHRAVKSAIMERNIGIGALGFHAYLQKNNIAFGSVEAQRVNMEIFQHKHNKEVEANLQLGLERGEAPDAEGTGKRCSLISSVAPNASSSIIVGNTSPSIEPYNSNAYSQKTSSGKGINKNKFLDILILEKCRQDNTLDYDDIMSSIVSNSGSVQHLSCLSDHEKDVFKTFKEVDQRWVIQHAADRQPFIDQGQSVNLFLDPSEVTFSEVHNILFSAWKMGLKTLYYNRSKNTQQAADIYKFEKYQRQQLNEDDSNECVACEG